MNWRATISLRKALPIWAIPKGTFIRPDFWTFRKFTKIPCAVSGRRYILLAPSAVDPISVENIKLNWRTSVQLLVPEIGQTILLSTIIWRSSTKLLSFKAFAILAVSSSFFRIFSSTCGLVWRYNVSSNFSPNLFFALATSFSILSSYLAIWSSISTSARYLFFESLLSINGSLKASTCPEAFQIVGCMKMAESNPTTFSCNSTIESHQYFLILFFSSTPYCP